MTSQVEASVNSIVAEALAKAGVTPSNIELPPESAQSEPASQERGRPKLDGTFKGEVKGQELEPTEEVTPESKAEKPSESESGKKVEQSLAKTDIEALINQASAKFQSIMDRKINQLQSQVQQTVGALNQLLQSQEDSSFAGLPAEEQVLKRIERLEKGGGKKLQVQPVTAIPIAEQPVQFYQHLADFVDTVGLKIDDKRIDWAADTDDPNVGFNRFLGSIKKSLVEDQTKVIQELKNSGDREIQKIRKKTGTDKVSTSGAGGAGLPNIDKMTPFEKLTYAFQQNEVAGKT